MCYCSLVLIFKTHGWVGKQEKPKLAPIHSCKQHAHYIWKWNCKVDLRYYPETMPYKNGQPPTISLGGGMIAIDPCLIIATCGASVDFRKCKKQPLKKNGVTHKWQHLVIIYYVMMTSWNGNIFCVTGHLCGEFIGPRWIPSTKASDAKLWWGFFDLCPNKRLSKQWWGWWFETPSRPLWRHRNDDRQ